jgi:hypothetical protein
MLRYLWRNYIAERMTESVRARIGHAETETQREALEEQVRALEARLATLECDGPRSKTNLEREWLRNFFIPSFDVHPKLDSPFMADSTCTAKDFFHPDFTRICSMLDTAPVYHRKIWEWVFMVHHLGRREMLREGRRGLGFGVGTEPLPSLFAHLGVGITATDAPDYIGLKEGWQNTNEFARSLDDLYKAGIISRNVFDTRVTYQPCDMTAIDDSLRDYDFCWSSCCLEHLGSLRNGLDFICNSVERTLRVGGVACHTTELNLSSNTDTITSGGTVIYRRCDLEAFIQEMRERGHKVEELRIASDSHSLDFYVDTPPYAHNPHLKLRLMDYTTTSVGLVIVRGR